MRQTNTRILATTIGALLLVSLLLELWLIPSAISQVSETFPEVRAVVGPALAWEIVAFACVQSIAVLLGYRSLGRKPRENQSVRSRVNGAILVAAALFIVLVVVALIGLTQANLATPLLMFALIAAGVIGVVFAGGFAWFLGASARIPSASQPHRA